MVIFHSYVSLPEGNSSNQWIGLRKNRNRKPELFSHVFIMGLSCKFSLSADGFQVVRAQRQQCGAALGSCPTDCFVHIPKADGRVCRQASMVFHKLWDYVI